MKLGSAEKSELPVILKSFCMRSRDATKWDIGVETLNGCAKGNEGKPQEQELFIKHIV